MPCLLIDIVKRERETQAARVLAGPGVTWGHRNNDRLASFKRIAKSFGRKTEATWLLVKMYAMRSMLMDASPLASCFKLESLILAQNERWRQA